MSASEEGPQSYCVDTSSLIAAWHELYPIENFPGFWGNIDALIAAGRLWAPDEVLIETKPKSDELHNWLRDRSTMFVKLDSDARLQPVVSAILRAFPRLVGELKDRTRADPFVIALAEVRGLCVVTQESPMSTPERPRIPLVCGARDVNCLNILGLIRAEKWRMS